VDLIQVLNALQQSGTSSNTGSTASNGGLNTQNLQDIIRILPLVMALSNCGCSSNNSGTTNNSTNMNSLLDALRNWFSNGGNGNTYNPGNTNYNSGMRPRVIVLNPNSMGNNGNTNNMANLGNFGGGLNLGGVTIIPLSLGNGTNGLDDDFDDTDVAMNDTSNNPFSNLFSNNGGMNGISIIRI
jgi:hypothetical protein